MSNFLAAVPTQALAVLPYTDTGMHVFAPTPFIVQSRGKPVWGIALTENNSSARSLSRSGSACDYTNACASTTRGTVIAQVATLSVAMGRTCRCLQCQAAYMLCCSHCSLSIKLRTTGIPVLYSKSSADIAKALWKYWERKIKDVGSGNVPDVEH